jgi:hypothetical protein
MRRGLARHDPDLRFLDARLLMLRESLVFASDKNVAICIRNGTTKSTNLLRAVLGHEHYGAKSDKARQTILPPAESFHPNRGMRCGEARG